MRWKIFFSLIFFLVAILLLIFYWFFPFGEVNFGMSQINSNFSLTGVNSDMQFYSNMRYPDSNISYKIHNCPIQKTNDMQRAFQIISNLTFLRFYPADSNEEISVSCEQNQIYEGGMFIAGEGGPTNITETGDFNVILNGEVLLISEVQCERPNVAIHELLHALGFKHSDNPNNIMYNYSKCSQTIGDDIPNLINKLYSTPSYPDLSFENASASMHGRYLDINVSIRNNGLKESGDATLIISADGEKLKEIDLKYLDIGYGVIISLTDVWVNKLNVNEIELSINSNFNEVSKENNNINLEIQKK